LIFRQIPVSAKMPTRVDSRAAFGGQIIRLETVPARCNPKRSHALHSLAPRATRQPIWNRGLCGNLVFSENESDQSR